MSQHQHGDISMRQLFAVIGAAIRAALRVPLDFLEALFQALRPTPITDAADAAIDQVEQAIAQAQTAGRQPETPKPTRNSDHEFDLEAEIRSTLAYIVV